MAWAGLVAAKSSLPGQDQAHRRAADAGRRPADQRLDDHLLRPEGTAERGGGDPDLESAGRRPSRSRPGSRTWTACWRDDPRLPSGSSPGHRGVWLQVRPGTPSSARKRPSTTMSQVAATARLATIAPLLGRPWPASSEPELEACQSAHPARSRGADVDDRLERLDIDLDEAAASSAAGLRPGDDQRDAAVPRTPPRRRASGSNRGRHRSRRSAGRRPSRRPPRRAAPRRHACRCRRCARAHRARDDPRVQQARSRLVRRIPGGPRDPARAVDPGARHADVPERSHRLPLSWTRGWSEPPTAQRQCAQPGDEKSSAGARLALVERPSSPIARDGPRPASHPARSPRRKVAMPLAGRGLLPAPRGP